MLFFFYVRGGWQEMRTLFLMESLEDTPTRAEKKEPVQLIFKSKACKKINLLIAKRVYWLQLVRWRAWYDMERRWQKVIIT